MVNWESELIKAQLYDWYVKEGRSSGQIAILLSTTAGNVKQNLHKLGIRKIHPDSGHPTKAETTHKKVVSDKDYAYRLMVLQGLELRKNEEIQPFPDEKLLAWKDINQYCKDLLFWEGKPLELLPYQNEFINMVENSKYSLLIGARQIGKDMLATAYTLWKCVTNPNYFAVIISPSQRQSNELFKRMSEFILRGDIYYSTKVIKSEEILFTNGSRILSLPALGSFTGLTHVSLCLINEAGRPEMPDNVISESMPMTMAVSGKLVLLGCPYSKTTSFYQYSNNPMFTKLHIKTEQNTSIPNLNEFLLKEKERCSVAEYLQQYEAEFTDIQDTFIPMQFLEAGLEDYSYNMKRESDKKYSIGIDWGIKMDQSALVVISKDAKNIVRVEYVQTWYQRGLNVVSDRLYSLWDNFQFDKIIPEEAGLSLDECRKLSNSWIGSRIDLFKPTNERQSEGWANLASLFEHEEIKIPVSERKLIDELRYLEHKELPSGKFRIDHPSGKHNDIATALMLACYGLRKNLDIGWWA
jgi:hypothetical protein